jgi:hypothetical protein
MLPIHERLPYTHAAAEKVVLSNHGHVDLGSVNVIFYTEIASRFRDNRNFA